jgi:hypothetical protein
LLLRRTQINGFDPVRLAEMQEGKIPGDWTDSGDNFGGTYIIRGSSGGGDDGGGGGGGGGATNTSGGIGGKVPGEDSVVVPDKLVMLQERLISRFPPLQVPYDNLNGLTRTSVAWSTEDGIEWTPTFAMDEPRVACTNPAIMLGDNGCVVAGWQQYGTVAPGPGTPQLWQENGKLLLGTVMDFSSGLARYHQSLMCSRDGVTWARVSDPANGHAGAPSLNSSADGVMVPDGLFHSWNGGLIAPPSYTGSALSSVGGSATVEEWMFEPMPFVSNREHFYAETIHADFWSNRSARSPAALKVWFDSRNHGLETWPDWNKLGGWDGLSADLLSPPEESFQLRVGVTRRRVGRWSFITDATTVSGDGGGGAGSDDATDDATKAAASTSSKLTTKAMVATEAVALTLNVVIAEGGSVRVTSSASSGQEWILHGPIDGVSVQLTRQGLTEKDGLPTVGEQQPLIVPPNQPVVVQIELEQARLYAMNWMSV